MSLLHDEFEGGKNRSVALPYAPSKAGRGLIYEEPFTIILYPPQKNVIKNIRDQ